MTPGEFMDRRPWLAIFHRVAKSWTKLKRLSTHGNYQFIYIYVCVSPDESKELHIIVRNKSSLGRGTIICKINNGDHSCSNSLPWLKEFIVLHRILISEM